MTEQIKEKYLKLLLKKAELLENDEDQLSKTKLNEIISAISGVCGKDEEGDDEININVKVIK